LLCFGLVMLALTRFRGKQQRAGTPGMQEEPVRPAARY